MKKDITIPEVKDVHVAVVKQTNKQGEQEWNAFIINNKNHMIEGVMITSKGYEVQGNQKITRTSVLRHVIGNVPAKTAAKIELVNDQVFEINNEYWVTFFEENQLMEKKYTFMAHVICDELLEDLPVMSDKGVIIY
jgi:hypothetical protein